MRAAGEQLGWGFQLQSPAVVTALAALFFVLALNLSGVFEFGAVRAVGSSRLQAKNRTVDAFASGVLAVVIASPCTAPFMGAALGYALAGSTARRRSWSSSRWGSAWRFRMSRWRWFPGWRRRLPRPGPGCERLKELLAFPLYATVIWLAWVLGAQRDNDALVRLMIALLCLGFALWTWRIVRTGGARPWAWRGLVVLAAAVTVAWPLFATEAMPAAQAADAGGHDADRDGRRSRRPRWRHSRRRVDRCSSISRRRGASRAR